MLQTTEKPVLAAHTFRVQQLFIKHQNDVKAFVLAFQPDWTDAEEVLQEVFLTITQKAADFEEGSNFVAWARQIAKFKILESARRRNASPQALSEDVIEALSASAPESLFSEEQFAAVRGCVEKLAPNARKMIAMRYRSEHRPEEIARRLSWTVSAVNTALSKARSFLRECVSRKLVRSEGH
jgi:RNA polymerase sigma-70 factor (ECF subfamily)